MTKRARSALISVSIYNVIIIIIITVFSIAVVVPRRLSIRYVLDHVREEIQRESNG